MDCIFPVNYEYSSLSKKQKAQERVYVLYMVNCVFYQMLLYNKV